MDPLPSKKTAREPGNDSVGNFGWFANRTANQKRPSTSQANYVLPFSVWFFRSITPHAASWMAENQPIQKASFWNYYRTVSRTGVLGFLPLGGVDSPVVEISSAPDFSKMAFARLISSEFSA